MTVSVMCAGGRQCVIVAVPGHTLLLFIRVSEIFLKIQPKLPKLPYKRK